MCNCWLLAHWLQGDPVPAAALSGVGVLMLQREVPESVNLAAAQAAAAAGIPVMLVSDPDACRGLLFIMDKCALNLFGLRSWLYACTWLLPWLTCTEHAGHLNTKRAHLT